MIEKLTEAERELNERVLEWQVIADRRRTLLYDALDKLKAAHDHIRTLERENGELRAAGLPLVTVAELEDRLAKAHDHIRQIEPDTILFAAGQPRREYRVVWVDGDVHRDGGGNSGPEYNDNE